MERNGTWGTEITLKALVELLGVTMHVIQSTKDNFYIKYTPDESE